MKTKLRLKNFPISFYAVSLGLAGFTVAWQKAEVILGLNWGLSYFLFALSVAVFFIVSGVYFYKWIKFQDATKKEFNNPVKINFYPIIAKTTLLFSIILLGYNLNEFSKWVWVLGAVMQFGFTLLIMSFWLHQDKFELKHISPALFIPIVGNIIVPIAGVAHFPLEISWFFFSIGFFLWLIFMTIVFNRLVFHQPLPEKLIPTFFILMAPPAIGFIAYVKMTDTVDIFARLLYYFSLFMFIALLFQFRSFAKVKFYLSSWAYSFPLAAFVIATIFLYSKVAWPFLWYLSYFSLALLSVLIVFLAYRTIKAVHQRQICVEEND